VCVWWSQSDDEDLDLAPAQTEEGFAFDSNVQMPDDGFQLWWQVARLILTICSAEVLARWLQLIPLLHSILCSPIFMLTRSSSLPSTVTVFDSCRGCGSSFDRGEDSRWLSELSYYLLSAVLFVSDVASCANQAMTCHRSLLKVFI